MKYLLTLLILTGSFHTFSQQNSEVVANLEKMIHHMEEASLYRNTVHWDTLRTHALRMGNDAETMLDLKPAMDYLLSSIGDEHGRVYHNNQMIASYYSGELKEHQQSFQIDMYNKIQSGQFYFFHTELIHDSVGYVRIVGLPMGDNTQMAFGIENEICQLKNSGAKHWIVDLRYNGGGNMHPMAEGLASIIGEGKVGGSKGLNEKDDSYWKVKNGDFYYDDYSIELSPSCELESYPKVAVLTSLYTTSSGEALAVIFKGRDHARFFGQKTLGMITVTDWFVVDDTTAMTISVSYYRDRNDIVYTDFVDVDVELPFEEFPLSENDKCLKAAIDWLAN